LRRLRSSTRDLQTFCHVWSDRRLFAFSYCNYNNYLCQRAS
jgi:hypothetical protein